MKNLVLLVTVFIMFSCNNSDNKTTEQNTSLKPDGEFLFNNNCASCHKPNVDFTGPALRGAKSRWVDKGLLYEFVKDPTAVILKDDYAKELQKKYGSMMTASPNLSNADIDAILNYCDAYTQ